MSLLKSYVFAEAQRGRRRNGMWMGRLDRELHEIPTACENSFHLLMLLEGLVLNHSARKRCFAFLFFAGREGEALLRSSS
jgi:hypothetical protein